MFSEYVFMKIIILHGQQGNSEQKDTVRLSQAERQEIGNRAGWSEEIAPVEGPEVIPIMDQMEINVEKYTDRTWAVYINGKLLCVTAYKKGAYGVMEMLNQLWSRILRQETEVRTLIRNRDGRIDGKPRSRFDESAPVPLSSSGLAAD